MASAPYSLASAIMLYASRKGDAVRAPKPVGRWGTSVTAKRDTDYVWDGATQEYITVAEQRRKRMIAQFLGE